LLSFLLFLNSGGFIIIFFQVQNSVKQEMLDCIKSGKYRSQDIISFAIPTGQFMHNNNGYEWLDENEFRYSGRMYDVVCASDSGELKILYCLNDIPEEKIVSNFNNEINKLARGDLNNSSIKTSLLNIISQALVKNVFSFQLATENFISFSSYNEQIILREREIPSPPPKYT
jgi:hypothetical protein